jgi:transcriptional regulator with XRE-family HTH domain
MLIGERIKGILKEKKIHVNELAIHLETSPEYIYRIFKKDSISTELLIKISNFLNVPISNFFNEYQTNDKYTQILDFVIDIFKYENQEIDISFFLLEIYIETQKKSKLLKEFIYKNISHKTLIYYFYKYSLFYDFDTLIMFNENISKNQFKRLYPDELNDLRKKYSNFNLKNLSFEDSVDFYKMSAHYEYMLKELDKNQLIEYNKIYKIIEKEFIDSIDNNEIFEILKTQDHNFFWKMINQNIKRFYDKYDPFPKE